jgi:hypothetical protein
MTVMHLASCVLTFTSNAYGAVMPTCCVSDTDTDTTMRKGARSEQYPDVPRCTSWTFGVPNRCTPSVHRSRLG